MEQQQNLMKSAEGEDSYVDTSIFVADEWQGHLGFNDEVPKPNNFKHPNRCHIVWNSKFSCKEWRQYMGAGKTCVPELKKKL